MLYEEVDLLELRPVANWNGLLEVKVEATAQDLNARDPLELGTTNVSLYINVEPRNDEPLLDM